MQTFFLVCFGVGVGYIIIGFLLGEVLGAFDADLEIDGPISPFKPSVLASFFTVFGGVGVLLLSRVGLIPAISLSGLIGLLVSYAIYRFVVVPLYRAQNTSAIEIQSLVGHTATVTETIPQGRYGKITYVVEGSTFTAPAKSEDGMGIARLDLVEIMYIEKNTYYVRRK